MTKSQTPSEVIAVRLKETRLRRGLSVAKLAKICADLGAPRLNRAVIANMEVVGRRQDVGVNELLVLALALDVPPVDLLLPSDPVGEERTWLQITPNYEVSAWGALLWLSGESERFIPSDNEDGSVPLERRRAWREAEQRVRLYRSWLNRFELAAKDEKRGGAGKLALADVLNSLLAAGINPPPTPDDWVEAMRENGWLERPDEVPVQPKWSD